MGTPKHYNKIPFRELKDEALEATGTGGFLTKPCPLMDDGKWIHCFLTVNKDSNGAYTYTENWSDSEYSSKYGLATNVTDLIRFSIANNKGYKYAECRCELEMTANPTGAMAIQGSTGWQVGTDKSQFYVVANSDAMAKIANSSTFYVDFYCYVVAQNRVTTE